jgi:hypothetical protein
MSDPRLRADAVHEERGIAGGVGMTGGPAVPGGLGLGADPAVSGAPSLELSYESGVEVNGHT